MNKMLLTLERHLNYWQHLQFNVRLPTLITIAETIKFWPMNLHLQMFVHFVFVFVYIVQIYLLVSQNYENGALPILTTKHHLLTTYMPHGHSELVKLQMEKKTFLDHRSDCHHGHFPSYMEDLLSHTTQAICCHLMKTGTGLCYTMWTHTKELRAC